MADRADHHDTIGRLALVPGFWLGRAAAAADELAAQRYRNIARALEAGQKLPADALPLLRPCVERVP